MKRTGYSSLKLITFAILFSLTTFFLVQFPEDNSNKEMKEKCNFTQFTR